MKKVLYGLCAMLLCMTACQKEEVDLTALIDNYNGNDAKMYVNEGGYACWENNDQVKVNNQSCYVSVSNSSAVIAGVASADCYRAVYPASIVSGNIESNAVSVNLPAEQTYKFENGHQVLAAPMAAYCDGTTLRFHNLGSLIKVTVANDRGSGAITVNRIVVTASNACLSGAGSIENIAIDEPVINMMSNQSNSVTLNCPNGVVVNQGASKEFYISIPAVASSDNKFSIKVCVSESDNLKYEYARNQNSSFTIARNEIVAVPFSSVAATRTLLPAELVDGETFNQIIKELDGTEIDRRAVSSSDYNVRTIEFQCNSNLTTEILVSTSTSNPIYASWNMSTKTITISTPASSIYANVKSRSMFQKFEELESIVNLSVLNTSNVTNMSNMFEKCNVSSLNLSNFNTSNVTNMSGMFYDCGVTSLDLSNFNTSNVTDMSDMFNDCGVSSLDLSNFNTSNVTDMRQTIKYNKKDKKIAKRY